MDIRKAPARTPKVGRTRAMIAVVAAVVCAAFIWLRLHPASPAVERSKLWIDRVQTGTFVHDIRANGILVPREVRWLAASTPGTVATVPVQAGARVKAGDVIATLTNVPAQSAVSKARAALAAATADAKVAQVNANNHKLDLVTALAQASSDYETTKIQHESLQAAFNGGAASEISLRENGLKLAAQEALLKVQRQRLSGFNAALDSQYAAAAAHRDEAAIGLALAEQDVRNLTITSPVDGTVQQVTAEPGQQLAVGANVAKVATEGNMVARLQVPEADAKDLVAGLDVALAIADDNVVGKVSRIDPAVTNGYVAVDVSYDQTTVRKARPDLSVVGSIVIATIPNAMSIARPAGSMPGSRGTIFVIPVGGDLARKTNVVYGAASTQRIQVLEGLAPGDEVVLSDLGDLEQHQTLELN